MPQTKNDVKYADILAAYDEHIDEFDLFQKNVRNFFEGRRLSRYVHSVRYRLKEKDHLVEKVDRKNLEDCTLPAHARRGQVTSANVFERITDIAGIRVIHLHMSQFKQIHLAILRMVDDGDFTLFEDPCAYTWDPESAERFESMGLRHELKESYYTSIHYVLRPNSRSCATCEVQVRTLLEEVWGEIDHAMNYPNPAEDTYCREQIRILARLVGAGGHLADSIMRRYGTCT